MLKIGGDNFHLKETIKSFNQKIMEEDNIKCPKCRSTQLTTNKKGFSGKQAIGGAILTGGIGLLAGTIGSNKVVITCLKCGNKFNIGQDFESKRIQNKKVQEINDKLTNNNAFTVFVKIMSIFIVSIVLLIIIYILFSIFV